MSRSQKKFTLGEEHRLRVFENRVLRRIFVGKEELTGSWRKLRSENFHVYCSPDIRVMKTRTLMLKGHVAGMGEMRNSYKILVGISEGKRTLGRGRLMLEDDGEIPFFLKGIA
jgi:hypothetical protein